MKSKNYDDFRKEANRYKKILLEYKNKGTVFVDSNFHPTAKIVEREKSAIFNESIDEWVRVDEISDAPLFQKDLIDPDFVRQGELGDCYFLAAISRVAQQSELIPKLFNRSTSNQVLGKVPNSINIKCGAVVVNFYCFGRKTPVLIDTLLPKRYGVLRYAKLRDNSKSPWFLLVEKAYAKLNGSYSDIVGGTLPQAIYNIFGYYPKTKFFKDLFSKEKVEKMSPFDRIMKYQKQSAVMGTSIVLQRNTNGVTDDELEKKGLLGDHCYLLRKARIHNGKRFLCLRNPCGEHEWNGDWSDSSPLWTPELKEALGWKDADDGTFWMNDTDFFRYFIEVEVSRPIPSEWHSKRFFYQLTPGDHDGYPADTEKSKMTERPNFAFQVKEPIPKGEKCKFFVLVEKRHKLFNEKEMTLYNAPECCVYFAHAGGKKLDPKQLPYCQRQSVSSRANIFSTRYEVCGNDDIVTIALCRLSKCDLVEDCYVLVYCEKDFKLYDIDRPEEEIEEDDNPGIIFNNYSTKHPSVAPKIKRNDKDEKDDEELDSKSSRPPKSKSKVTIDAPKKPKDDDDDKKPSKSKSKVTIEMPKKPKEDEDDKKPSKSTSKTKIDTPKKPKEDEDDKKPSKSTSKTKIDTPKKPKDDEDDKKPSKSTSKTKIDTPKKPKEDEDDKKPSKSTSKTKIDTAKKPKEDEDDKKPSKSTSKTKNDTPKELKDDDDKKPSKPTDKPKTDTPKKPKSDTDDKNPSKSKRTDTDDDHEIERIKKENERLKELIEQMKKEKEEALDAKDKLISKYKKTSKKLRDVYDAEKKEKEKAVASYNKLKTASTKMKEEKNKEIEGIRGQIDKLKKEADEATKSLNSLKDEKEKSETLLNNEVANLKNEVKELKAKVRKIENEKEKKQNEIDQLKTEIQDLRKKNESDKKNESAYLSEGLDSENEDMPSNDDVELFSSKTKPTNAKAEATEEEDCDDYEEMPSEYGEYEENSDKTSSKAKTKTKNNSDEYDIEDEIMNQKDENSSDLGEVGQLSEDDDHDSAESIEDDSCEDEEMSETTLKDKITQPSLIHTPRPPSIVKPTTKKENGSKNNPRHKNLKS